MGKFVLGMGNILLRDEGIGCHVVHALESRLGGTLTDVKIIDGGTCPDVVQLIDNADKLIIVDAVEGGGISGQIYRFHLKDIHLEQKPFLSLHDVGLVDNLLLKKLWHTIGETVIIGVEPKDISWGLELSKDLQDKMPQIIDTVLSELNTSADLSIKREEYCEGVKEK